jgi:hypothetical protein
MGRREAWLIGESGRAGCLPTFSWRWPSCERRADFSRPCGAAVHRSRGADLDRIRRHGAMKQSLHEYLAAREALFRNPSDEGARAWWTSEGYAPPFHPTAPLATVHKGRLQWLDALHSFGWLAGKSRLPPPPLPPFCEVEPLRLDTGARGRSFLPGLKKRSDRLPLAIVPRILAGPPRHTPTLPAPAVRPAQIADICREQEVLREPPKSAVQPPCSASRSEFRE